MFRTTGVKSAKFIKKKRRQMLLRAGIVFIALSVVVFLSYELAIWQKLIIQKIRVTGNTTVSSDAIIHSADTFLQGNYFWIYPKKNVVLYPKREIEAKILTDFKRIKNISLGVNDDNVLYINIEERKPAALWCGEEMWTEDKNPCYYLDSSAYIFENAPDFSDNVYLKYYGPLVSDVASSSTPIGQTYLPLESFNTLISFVDDARKIGLSITGLATKPMNEYELYIKNTTATTTDNGSSTGTILFNDQQSFEKTLDNLNAFVTEYRTRNKGNLPSVDYIDMRYGNSIIYKFR